MDSFLEQNKNNISLHHAYFFIEQNITESQEKLKKFLKNKLNIKFELNPDVYIRKFETLTMSDAEFVRNNENRKVVSGNKKIFILETDFITEEAQNALLKVFEEPTPDTYFFIFSPQDILLPTLKSRVQLFIGDTQSEEKNILKMSVSSRLKLVKEITDGIKDEEMTKQDAIILLNSIEKSLYAQGVEKRAKELKICESTRASLFDRGAPIKMILENLMLNI